MIQLYRMLICTVLLLIVLCGCAYMLTDYLDRPYLLVSYSTRECVAIRDADGSTHPCSVKDDHKKYIWVWVK